MRQLGEIAQILSQNTVNSRSETADRASYLGPWAAMDPTRGLRDNYSPRRQKNKKYKDIETKGELFKICCRQGFRFLAGESSNAYIAVARRLRIYNTNDISTEITRTIGALDVASVIIAASLASIIISNALKRKGEEHGAWKILRFFWNLLVRFPLAVAGTVFNIAWNIAKRIVSAVAVLVSAIIWYPVCKAVWKHARANNAEGHAQEGHRVQILNEESHLPDYQHPTVNDNEESHFPEYQHPTVNNNEENIVDLLIGGPVEYMQQML